MVTGSGTLSNDELGHAQQASDAGIIQGLPKAQSNLDGNGRMSGRCMIDPSAIIVRSDVDPCGRRLVILQCKVERLWVISTAFDTRNST